ncbi:hypothetical protein DWX09_25410 [Escherichia coli]|nr:hypothetical protein DWX09_25410 [Escherichia coli]
MVLTVPRALSRIHHITKFTLKRAAEQSRSKTDTAKRHQKIDNRGVAAGLSLKRMVNLTTRCPQWGKE